MDLSAISPTLLITSLLVAATPIILAAIGELPMEKAALRVPTNFRMRFGNREVA